MDDPTVFVVDDDSDFAAQMKVLLKSVGRLCVTFDTAEQFREYYVPHMPGCLLLDVRMPGMSGLALQEDLASRHITLPIIIVTGFPEWNIVVQALKGGA